MSLCGTSPFLRASLSPHSIFETFDNLRMEEMRAVTDEVPTSVMHRDFETLLEAGTA